MKAICSLVFSAALLVAAAPAAYAHCGSCGSDCSAECAKAKDKDACQKKCEKGHDHDKAGNHKDKKKK